MTRIADWKLYRPDRNFHVFVEVLAENGLSGWGAAYSQSGQVTGAFDWLKRFVIGENALEVERVTEKLHQVTFWVGRGGAMTHAISAVNLALWDLAGKLLGQPVHRLLGGACSSAVPAYASILFHPAESLSDRVAATVGRGFRAIKVGWDPFGQGSLREDEDLVRTARESAGDCVDLMVDAGGSRPFCSFRLKDALERARMLADYDVAWFEEALVPDDIEGYARLTDLSPVRIAHGEVLTRRQSFLPYFQRRAMDIVQPDVAKVGGLSEMRRIAWMAEPFGIDLVPHGWNTAVGVAADIHLTATLPGRTFVEFNVGNPLVEEMIDPPFRLNSEGRLPVPQAPGLGVEPVRDRLQKLEADGFASPSWTWDERGDYEAR